ncbi:MAG: ATP-binding protein [Promethearchaeota archaeon]
MNFIDRNSELEEIREVLESKKFELIIIYGRRRIGKTALILHSTEGMKRIYYLGVGRQNLDRFYRECGNYNKEFLSLRKDFDVLFSELSKKVNIVILDEFQNLIMEDSNILHILQSVIDQKLKNTNLKVFLLGSSISILKSTLLNYKSPLYGRRTGSIKLQSIGFFNLRSFFPWADVKELIEIYGFTDGIPQYLIQVNKSFWNWLEDNLIKERSFLRDEIDFLLRYEFDNPNTYMSILQAIAFGKTKLNEIRNFCKMNRTDLSPYLRNLMEVDLIMREVPITEKLKSRFGRYYIKDNFLKFWFRFIFPNISAIEAKIFDITLIQANYSQFLGRIFEDVAKQYLIKAKIFKFSKIGRWWWKDIEIDLVALNDLTNEIFFVECKWKRNVDPEEILAKLDDKVRFVKWHLDNRIEFFGVIARNFTHKISKFHGKKVFCIDLKDIDKLIN